VTDKYRIFGYARTSTEEQKSGLEVQKDHIEARAKRQMSKDDGAEWKGCYHEHESATVVSWEKRKEFQAMFAELEKGDMLIVWRLNRIDRKPFRMHYALNMLHEHGVRVLVIKFTLGGDDGAEVDLDTVAGRSFVALLGIMADIDSSSRSEDAKAGVQRRIAQGYTMGDNPAPGKRFERRDLPPGDTTVRKINGGTQMNVAVWDEEQCNIIRELWIRARVFNEDLQSIAIDFCERRLLTQSRPTVTVVPAAATGQNLRLRWKDKKSQEHFRDSGTTDPAEAKQAAVEMAELHRFPWVRAYEEKESGHDKCVPDKARTCWGRDRLYVALKMVDKHLEAGTLPPELRVDEETVRWVAQKMVDRAG